MPNRLRKNHVKELKLGTNIEISYFSAQFLCILRRKLKKCGYFLIFLIRIAQYMKSPWGRSCFQRFSQGLRVYYITFLNNAMKSSTEASFGFPGAHASACADSARNWRSSSFRPFTFVGIPTSTES